MRPDVCIGVAHPFNDCSSQLHTTQNTTSTTVDEDTNVVCAWHGNTYVHFYIFCRYYRLKFHNASHNRTHIHLHPYTRICIDIHYKPFIHSTIWIFIVFNDRARLQLFATERNDSRELLFDSVGRRRRLLLLGLNDAIDRYSLSFLLLLLLL